MEPGEYFQNLERELRIEPQKRKEVLVEIRAHVEDRTQELQELGLKRDEALAQVLRELGEPRLLAQKLYAVHTRGSWIEVFLAITPHLICSVLFALHLWRQWLWIVAALLAVALVSFWEWRKGKPSWSYTWLGYSLVAPTLAWILALFALGYGLYHFFTVGWLPLSLPLYIALIFYTLFALWILGRIVIQVILRDWLLASLTGLPLPFIGLWFYLAQKEGSLFGPQMDRLREVDTGIAVASLVLALITALFFLIGQRKVRAALLLLIPTPLLLLLPLLYFNPVDSVTLLLFPLASLLLLAMPALLESMVIHPLERSWSMERIFSDEGHHHH